MWRWLAVWCFLLCGCARLSPVPAPGACGPVEDNTVLLTVREQDAVQQRLLLRGETGPNGPVFVALDTLGAPLFRAQPKDGQWQLEVSKLYRGPDAKSLLSAFMWWQRREHLTPSCVNAAGLTLGKTSNGLDLSRGSERWWLWSPQRPYQFTYADYRVDVKQTAVTGKQ